MLDADEFLNNNYRYLIQEHIHKPDVKIGRIKITSVFEENGLKQYATSYISRLFPKGILFKGNIHEQLDSDLPREIIDVEVFHVGYFQTDKTGRNLPLLLETLKKEPNDCYILYQTAKEYKKLNDYKKAIEFFSRAYHFLTKNESFSPSLIVDFIQLLTKDGQYEHALDIASKEEVFLSFYPDFYFAKGILLMEHVSKKVNPTMDDLKRVEQTFQMCLNIGEQTKVDGMVGTGSFLPAYNLSILYETVGLEKEAVYYLNKAAMWGFEPAILRLNK
jgi:tetratricopeptide (TPR) repeat protein